MSGEPSSATTFTRMVGCERPIQMAAMPGIGSPALCAAVSDAGGFGMLSVVEPDFDGRVAAVRERTGRPFGVNVLMPFLDVGAMEAAAAAGVALLEFFYGDPDAGLVQRARAAGAPHVGWQVGSRDEAAAAVHAGCDVVIAQGVEAGGHVRGTAPLDELLVSVLDLAGDDVAVVAAGGIAEGARVAELLQAGADAVRVGTRFVAAEESDAHPRYVEAVLAAGPDSTVLTERFGVGWPDAPHRVLAGAVAAAEAHAPNEPVATLDGDDLPVWSVIPPTVHSEGDADAMAMYAGMSVGAVNRREPAAAIVRDLAASLTLSR